LVGVRQVSQLLAPRMIPIKHLYLPMGSVYQFFEDGQAILGPSPQDPYLTAIKGKVFIEHVSRLDSTEGAPKRTVLNPDILENEFRRKNRLFKPLRKDDALVLNQQNTLVVNYNLLNSLYRYIPSYKATYFRWFNNQKTFWDNVVKTHERFGWNQYINFHMPERLPTLGQFVQMQAGATQKNMEVFSTPAMLSAFDLYQWLGNNRADSLLATVPEEALDKINFVFKARSYFFVWNLGQINDWRKDLTEDTTDTSKMTPKELRAHKQAISDRAQGVAGDQLQRRFVVLLHSLADLINGSVQLDGKTADAEGAIELKPNAGQIEKALGKDDKKPVAPPVAAEPAEDEKEDSAKDEELTEDDELDFGLGVDFGDTMAPPTTQDEFVMDTSLVEDDEEEEHRVLPTEELSQAGLDEEVDMQKPTTSDLLTGGVIEKAWELSELQLITPRAYQRAIDDAETYKTLPNPYGTGGTLEEAMTYQDGDLTLPEEVKFPDADTIFDKSMLSSNLKAIQTKYIRKLMAKDVLNVTLAAIQQQGVAVKDYQIETVRDAMNHYQIHTVTVKPLRGRQSTLRFRLPVLDDDGRFVSNGVTYKYGLQRADQPIRKINPTRVALTSYYNKTFVDRSGRAVNDFDNFISKNITRRGLDPQDATISDVRFSSVFDMSLQLPRFYTLLAKRFVSFQAGEYVFFLDHKRRAEFFDTALKLDVHTIETPTQVAIAHNGKQLVLMDTNNALYLHTDEGLEVLGTLPDILGIDTNGAPVEAAEMTVANKVLPVGLVLGYASGLTELIRRLGCEVSRHRRGERIQMGADDYALTFQDEVLVFSKLDYRATLVLNGLNRYHRTLKQYSVWDFDRKDVYFRILEDNDLGVRYLREIDALFKAWMDPITRGMLEEMGEPTEFGPLVLRAVELLMTDYSPEEVDGAFMRYRGYERFAGMVYGELSRSVKSFNNRSASGDHAVELNPHAVWMKIVQDPSAGMTEESNPFQNLREQERMTFRGDGGRGGQSMVERTRIFHESDKGVVSESTVDSGDVGVIAYAAPDANLKNMRGFTRPFDKERDGAAKLFSASALNAPCADHDDMKRINFIAIQQAQGVSADGYTATPLRTGYEQIIAQRTTATFATCAEQDGEVISVNKHAVTVRYADGSETRVALGKVHGNAAGTTYPHDVITDLKAGDRIRHGDTLAYNRKFFTPDRMSPGKVIVKAGVMGFVAMIDDIETFEDGSAISESMAKKLNTQTTEVKTIQVRFDQTVHGLVQVGDHVDLETILCTIEDPETANNVLFGGAALDTLRRLSQSTPRAKVVGDVAKIEVFYHGDFEDMSENLQAIAAQSDKERKTSSRAQGKPAFTGEVDTSFRVSGKALDPDTVAIRIYIDHDVAMGVGDKAVMGNQMKTVISRVFSGTNATESGIALDAKFGNTSVEARMVNAPKLSGTTNILLWLLSQHVPAVYRGTANAKAKS
jgi:hypothetical protein